MDPHITYNISLSLLNLTDAYVSPVTLKRQPYKMTLLSAWNPCELQIDRAGLIDGDVPLRSQNYRAVVEKLGIKITSGFFFIKSSLPTEK